MIIECHFEIYTSTAAIFSTYTKLINFALIYASRSRCSFNDLKYLGNINRKLLSCLAEFGR